MKKIFVLFFLMAFACGAQAVIIIDPGFEAQPLGTVTTDNGNPGEWVSYNGDFAIVDSTTGVVRTGNQAAKVGVRDMPNVSGDKYSNFRQLYTEMPVPAAIENKTWTVSAWIYHDGPSTDAMQFGFRASDWWNTNVTESMLTILGSDLTNGVWTYFETSIFVPEANIDPLDPDYLNKIKRNATLMIVQNGWIGQGGTFYVDDVTMSNGIPEPATIMLLGLGGLALLRKRR